MNKKTTGKFIFLFLIGLLLSLFCIVVSADEIGFNSTGETAYLRLSIEKYGKTYTSSSNSINAPTIDVLEYTEWQLKATYVVIEDGKIKSQRDVTNQCTWTSTDKSGDTISVSSGKVIAGFYNGYKYTVCAKYEGLTITKNSSVVKTYSAKMIFNVKKISASGNNISVLRNVLLTAYAEDDWLAATSNKGKTIAESLHYVWTNRNNNSISYTGSKSLNINNNGSQYLCYKSIADMNSAIMMNAYSGIIGNYIIKTTLTGTNFNTVILQNDSQIYVVFLYTGNDTDIYGYSENGNSLVGISYDNLFGEVENIFKAILGNATDYSNYTFLGYGVGGLAANYLSYYNNCTAFSIECPSAINIARKRHFLDFCQNYEQDRQTIINVYSYGLGSMGNVTTSIGNRITLSYNNYCKNKYGKFIKYNKQQECIYVVVSSSTGQIQTHSNYDDVYYGTSVGDTFAFSYGASPAYIFGGAGSDCIYLDKTVDYIAATKIGWNIYSLTSSAWKKVLNNTKLKTAIAEVLTEKVGDVLLQLQYKDINGLMFDDNPDPYYWIDLLISNVSTLSENALNLIDLPGLILQYLDDNINKYIVGGKGNDTIIGSWYDDGYCYSYGDGVDTIVDCMGHDSVYLLGFESCDSLELNEIEGTIVVSLNGNTIIKFKAGGCGEVTFYQGSPFDSSKKKILVHVRNYLEKITYKIKHLRSYHFSCPVDILVMNGNGDVVYRLEDGEETYIQNNDGLFTVILEDGEYVKDITLVDDEWSVKAVGTDIGTMDYQFRIYDIDTETTESVSLSDIPVQKDEILSPTDSLDNVVLTADIDADGFDDIKYNQSQDKISFNDSQYTIEYGKNIDLSSELTRSGISHTGNWVSWDESIVKVDDNGNVVGVGIGTGKVSFTTDDGDVALALIVVTDSSMTADHFTITGLQESYEYTGGEIRPDFEIWYNSIELTENVDYTVDYQSNINPGQAEIKISGIGNYSQTKIFNFSIFENLVEITVDSQVSKIVKECKAYNFSTEYETALWLHDWLIENATYDFTYTYYDPSGILVHFTGVCQSYAEAYQLLLNECGIQNQVVYAPEMNHAWNIVELDGLWCHIDCTWDDPGTGGAENHAYFGLNDELMGRDHTWDTTAYHSCTSLSNYYYKREGYNCISDSDELSEVLNEKCAEQSDDIFLCYIGTDESFSLADSWVEWCSKNDWKYGISSYDSNGTEYIISLEIGYTDPWEQPREFTGVADCPYFTLRGPDGMYRLSDYKDNGIILIFGREGCFNTRGLLDSLYEHLSDLRAAGVEVMINEVDAEEPDDFGYLSENYPDFVYTYGNYALLSSLEEAVDCNYSTFPIVFFINKNERITYSSGGYVSDIDGFIQNALEIETDTELPEPSEGGSDYNGSYYCFKGEKTDSMVLAIQDQLKGKSTVLWAYDGLYDSDESSVSEMLDVIREIAEGSKEFDCDYEVDLYRYYYYPDTAIFGVPVTYDTHDTVTVSAKDPTCTEEGRTEGSYCSICGKVFTESKTLSALGHDMVYTAEIPATCSSSGVMAFYQCQDCGKYYYDESGTEEVTGSLIIPGGHDYSYIYSNNDGTHTKICSRDSSHTITENCNYTYTKVDEQDDGEHGIYECKDCSYSFEVVISKVTNKLIVLSEDYFIYDGNEKKPTVIIDGLAEGADYVLEYENNINAGTGSVRITGLGNYTGIAEIGFTIAKATPSVTAPTAKTLTYTGKAQALVNAGKTDGGEIMYCLTENGTYSTEIPIGTDIGNYTVYYKIAGNDNYEDVDPQSVNVTISKASSSVTLAPTAKKSLSYTGKAQALITAGKATGGTLQYSTDGKTYSTSIPTATNAGNYTVYYKVVGGTKYNDIAAKSFKVTIAKVTPKVTAPAAKTSLTYSGKAQALVTAGKTSGGTLNYSLDNKNWSTKIPTGTNAGSYTVYYKVVGSNNYNSVAAKSVKVTIAPSAVKISSLTNSASKTLLVKWSKNSKATGYEVHYSTNSKFTSAKTATITKNSTVSTKLTKLTKGKTYYVRVRAYKTVNNVKYYSSWSAVKSCKISK